MTFEIASEAARVRAATASRAPDALILATGSITDSNLAIANDDRWLGTIGRAGLAIGLVHLAAFSGVP